VSSKPGALHQAPVRWLGLLLSREGVAERFVVRLERAGGRGDGGAGPGVWGGV